MSDTPLRGLVCGLAAVVVAVFCATLIPLVDAQPSTEELQIQAARAIFRLEHQEIVARVGQTTPEIMLKPDGTAFAAKHNGQFFLITARHVAAAPYDLRARVPSRRNDNGVTEVIELRIPKESWIFHERGPEELREGLAPVTVRLRGVDVAVALLPGIKDRGIVVFGSCEPCPSGEVSQFAATDPTPPSSVFVTGFPGDLGFTLAEQRPLFRSAIVALVAGKRFLRFGVDGAFADERTFVIDRRVQPGNSGSPVFSVNPFSGAISLVGLVSATSEAGDYTVVEPVSRIRETIGRAVATKPPKELEWHLLSR